MINRHLAPLALAALLVALVYSKLSSAYYCCPDDFFDIHRASFEDRQDPARIFTTTHGGTPKYRPLHRSLTYITYWLGGGSPVVFRIRNLSFHLLSVAMVYGIAWMLFASPAIAFTGAVLFGLHPLANQSVAVAIWTNATANSLALLSLFLFIYGIRTKSRRYLWLHLSLLTAWVTLFVYEGGLAIFAWMFAYLLLQSLREQRLAVDRRFLLVLTIEIAILGLAFAGIRRLVVRAPMRMVPAATIAKNWVMDNGVFLLPVDSILAHDWFGTPLPSEAQNNPPKPAVRWAVLGGLLIAAALWCWRKPIFERMQAVAWPEILFLGFSGAFSLTPMLLFMPHPSETYLYLPAAFYVLITSAFIWQFFRSPRVSLMVAVLLILLAGTATWNRNERVVACGRMAHRLLSGLPLKRWQTGSWNLYLANVPQTQTPPPRYGIYSFQGTSTIDAGDSGTHTIQLALQALTGNQRITADVVPKADLPKLCPGATACFWVQPDGSVSTAGE